MGYRGKVVEQARARELRAQGHTLADIATTLSVSKSSVSLWVRDVEFTPSPRRTGAQRRPHPAHEAKLRQIEQLNAEGIIRIGVLSEEAFLAAGVALYAGEGSKTDGAVGFPNTDPRMVAFFCAWLRHFFDVDEVPPPGAALPSRRARSRRSGGVLVRGHTDPGVAIPEALPCRRRSEPTRHTPHVRLRHGDLQLLDDPPPVMGLVRALLSLEVLPG